MDQHLDLPVAATRRWAALFGIVAIAMIIVMAIPVLRVATEPLDERFWAAAVENEYPLPVAVAEAIDVLTGTLSMAIITIFGAAILAWQRRWTAFSVWLLITVITTALNAAIKIAYDRPRPSMGLAEHYTGSFMSGHALHAAVIALMIVLFWVPGGRRRKQMLVIGAVYAAIVATSRVYMRVHYFTDIVAGLAMGAAMTLVLLLLARWWMLRTAD